MIVQKIQLIFHSKKSNEPNIFVCFFFSLSLYLFIFSFQKKERRKKKLDFLSGFEGKKNIFWDSVPISICRFFYTFDHTVSSATTVTVLYMAGIFCLCSLIFVKMEIKVDQDRTISDSFHFGYMLTIA